MFIGYLSFSRAANMHTTWISKQRPEMDHNTRTHTADVRLHLSAPLTSLLHYVLHSKSFSNLISSKQRPSSHAFTHCTAHTWHGLQSGAPVNTLTHTHTQMPRRLWVSEHELKSKRTASPCHRDTWNPPPTPAPCRECQVRYFYKMWSWRRTHMQGTVLSV